jgi:hypothetical protein
VILVRASACEINRHLEKSAQYMGNASPQAMRGTNGGFVNGIRNRAPLRASTIHGRADALRPVAVSPSRTTQAR